MSRPRKLGMRDLGTGHRQGYPAQINIRLTWEDLADLHAACVAANLSASTFVRTAMRDAIDRLAEAEKK